MSGFSFWFWRCIRTMQWRIGDCTLRLRPSVRQRTELRGPLPQAERVAHLDPRSKDCTMSPHLTVRIFYRLMRLGATAERPRSADCRDGPGVGQGPAASARLGPLHTGRSS